MRVTYLGHATVLLEAAGTRVLTDPLLRPRVAHLRRLVPVSNPGPVDVVLISHAHHDHLHLPSLRCLAPGASVVVPRGYGKLARRGGFEDVREVEPGDRVSFGGVEVQATPAEHDGRRWPLLASSLALGFVVDAGRRVYFAGDTDLFDGMGELGVDLDLALLPVSGWGPKLPPGHLDAERAARAAALLRPRLAVPIHWGTYASPKAPVNDPERPAREFARLAESVAPGVEVRMLAPGEGLRLS